MDPDAMTGGAFGLGFALELLLGDPEGWPHPVRAVGALIARGETLCRRLVRSPLPAGSLLVVIVLILTVAPVLLARHLLEAAGPLALLLFDGVVLYLSLSANQLIREGRRLARLLAQGNLAAARVNLARLVSRRTGTLGEADIAKGAIETMGENFADGVVAPLFYFILGGPAGAVACKTINTLDSMIGYRDERYLEFGRAAARLDDLINWIPARLAGILLVLAAPLAGLSAAEALRIMRRDGRKHESPNAGIGKAAVAGALGVRLGGPALYADGLRDRPFIGEPRRPLDPGRVAGAARLLLAACLLTAALTLISAAAAATWMS